VVDVPLDEGLDLLSFTAVVPWVDISRGGQAGSTFACASRLTFVDGLTNVENSGARCNQPAALRRSRWFGLNYLILFMKNEGNIEV
jgi:hypothetical protein